MSYNRDRDKINSLYRNRVRIEGFNYVIPWDELLKLVILILLIVLFVILAKDLLFYTQEIPPLNLTEQSPLNLSTVAP